MNKYELESLTRRDPLAYGISYIDLLEQRQWEVDERAWIKEIYTAVNPWLIEKYPEGQARQVCYQKPTQVGLSTMGIVRLIHLADNWPVRLGYTLPRQQDVIDFVTTRFDPMIQASDRLRPLRGNPDSVHAKRLRDSYIFFMEASVEARMLPIDALFIDEIDLSDQTNIGTMQHRMDASRWKLSYYFSTPTLPNYGINGLYENSDKRQWFVKCPYCNHYQVMDWNNNLRVEGAASDPSRVYYGCQRCNKELTLPVIQTGEWVPEYPERSEDMIGFHISQLMTHPAHELYKAFRDPQTKLVEFYRKRLGMPFSIGGGSLERDDFLVNCFDDQYEAEHMHDGASKYYMGVDQGNELQVVIAKVPPSRRSPEIVHIEIVPYERGFERIAQLIKLFKIRKAVIDGDPNRHPVRSMQKDFPGKILMADYAEIGKRFQTKKMTGSKIVTNIVIGRTEGFDDVMESITDGYWSLFGNPSNLPPQVELLIDHVTAMRRDVETRKAPSGEVEVGVWRSARADHLAHALLYCKLAIEIGLGKGFRMRVIGAPNQQDETPEQDDDVYHPHPDTVKGIVYYLAEVPDIQIAEHLANRHRKDYKRPFPLSYKLGLCEEKFETKDIDYVLVLLAEKRL